jgi:hypothetical protein
MAVRRRPPCRKPVFCCHKSGVRAEHVPWSAARRPLRDLPRVPPSHYPATGATQTDGSEKKKEAAAVGCRSRIFFHSLGRAPRVCTPNCVRARSIQKDLHLARFNFHFFPCARDVLRHGDLRRSSTSRLVRDQLDQVLLPVSKSRSRSAMASSSWPWLYGFSTAEEPLVCKAVAHRDPKLLQALDAECGGTDPFCVFCRFESILRLKI